MVFSVALVSSAGAAREIVARAAAMTMENFILQRKIKNQHQIRVANEEFDLLEY
jgi:hypothetical protein